MLPDPKPFSQLNLTCLSHLLSGGAQATRPPHLVGASFLTENPFSCSSDNPSFLTTTGLTSLSGNKPTLIISMETVKGTLALLIHLSRSWDSPYVL